MKIDAKKARLSKNNSNQFNHNAVAAKFTKCTQDTPFKRLKDTSVILEWLNHDE